MLNALYCCRRAVGKVFVFDQTKIYGSKCCLEHWVSEVNTSEIDRKGDRFTDQLNERMIEWMSNLMNR